MYLEVNYLKISRKFGIAALVLLAVLVPLTVLGNSENDENCETDETGEKPFWGFHWFRGFGFGPWNGDKTVEEAVEAMAEKLGLTDEEVNEITPIAQEIADLREQMRARMEELHGVIGPKLDAFRESKMSEMPERFRGMRGRWGGRCCPCQETLDEETSSE